MSNVAFMKNKAHHRCSSAIVDQKMPYAKSKDIGKGKGQAYCHIKCTSAIV
jgi:hypothetical protein